MFAARLSEHNGNRNTTRPFSVQTPYHFLLLVFVGIAPNVPAGTRFPFKVCLVIVTRSKYGIAFSLLADTVLVVGDNTLCSRWGQGLYWVLLF